MTRKQKPKQIDGISESWLTPGESPEELRKEFSESRKQKRRNRRLGYYRRESNFFENDSPSRLERIAQKAIEVLK